MRHKREMILNDYTSSTGGQDRATKVVQPSDDRGMRLAIADKPARSIVILPIRIPYTIQRCDDPICRRYSTRRVAMGRSETAPALTRPVQRVQ